MIVDPKKIASDSRYRDKLFKKASELLGATDATDENYITGIYEYFMALPEIVYKAIEKGEDWKYYTTLPLDEPVMEVNANTREIIVPPALKTIGVVGDNKAEIIFFTIDRFFDTVDFGSPDMEAVIEWRRGSGANLVEDSDKAYIKELTLYDDKVLIGWPIVDIMTEEAGTIEFALRIFKVSETNEEDVVYSFSTKPAKVSIASTLNLYPESDSTLNDYSEDIKNRILKTRSPAAWGDNTVVPPIFDINMENLSVATLYSETNNYYADLSDNGTLPITLDATSQNGNVDDNLYYQWWSWSENLADWQTMGAQVSETAGGNSTTLSAIGKYKCEAIDKLSALRRNSASSQILHILPPEIPQVKVAEEGTEYYSVILNNPEEGVQLEVLPGLNDNQFYDKTYDKNNKTALSFSWSKGQEDSHLSDKELIVGKTTQQITVKEEGRYYGTVSTTRNGESESASGFTTYRVTEPVKVPSFYTTNLDDKKWQTEFVQNLEIIIEFDTKNKYDSLQYQWFVKDTSINEYVCLEDSEASGWLKQTDTKITYKPKTAGYYRVNIIAYRNGTSTEIEGADITQPNVGYILPRSNEDILQFILF